MGWKGPVTNRQHNTFLYYLQESMNTPSKTDYYIMQLSAIVGGLFSKKAPDVNKYKIEFKSASSATKKKTMSPQERAEYSQSTWMTMCGFNRDGSRRDKKMHSVTPEQMQIQEQKRNKRG